MSAALKRVGLGVAFAVVLMGLAHADEAPWRRYMDTRNSWNLGAKMKAEANMLSCDLPHLLFEANAMLQASRPSAEIVAATGCRLLRAGTEAVLINQIDNDTVKIALNGGGVTWTFPYNWSWRY